MFFALRTLYRLVYIALLVCGGLYLYQNRAVIDPVFSLVQAFRVDKGFEQKIQGEIKGMVTDIKDSETFGLKTTDNKRVSVKITGVDVPALPRLATRTNSDRKTLHDLILSNNVVVKITFADNAGRVLGLVYKEDQPIHVQLIKEGGARVDKTLLNGLPLKERYRLLQTERASKQAALKSIRSAD